MKNFNHHHGEHQYGKGFSFVEVVASLLMMGILLSALLTMEGSVLGRFRRSAQREDRIYPLKNYLLSLTQAGTDTSKKQELHQDGTTITLRYEPIKEKSALARFEGLQQQKLSAVWQDETKKRTLDLVGYTFTPPVKKEEKQ
jgi:predicted acylesterase/phospholipase RssA